MTSPGELSGLLADGERAVFHGVPGDAVAVLERAVGLAHAQGREADVAAAAWLLGVALVAGGRYGGALAVLSPLVDAGSPDGATRERRLAAGLAGASVAGVHRQLGRHDVARAVDLDALALAGTGTGTGAQVRFDALLGLAGDAVGLDEVDEAVARLADAAAVLPELADAGPVLPGLPDAADWSGLPERPEPGWRQRVRLGWVSAEVALLEGHADRAVALAQEAVGHAERARAPRHVAKGLLLQGIAQVGGEDGAAVGTLRRAAELAESVGALPLVWPSRALLGALVAGSDPAESARSLEVARAAARTVASDLPPAVRALWLARPDVGALLEG